MSAYSTLGQPEAPVTLIEFSDYQCPFCRRFFQTTLPTLKTEYIDTGKLRYVFRDFPLDQIHPYARKAAEAAHCAGDQGKYRAKVQKNYEDGGSAGVRGTPGFFVGKTRSDGTIQGGLNQRRTSLTCLSSGDRKSPAGELTRYQDILLCQGTVLRRRKFTSKEC